MQFTTKSPVLLLIFNRPALTEKVFEQIRKVQPPRLYIAADGPRVNKPGEAELCAASRAIVQQIDWECELKVLFREQNLGCKKAVSGAISWFFEQEEAGIILEDDCLPASSFFYFCETLLDKYRDDERIHAITGTNLQNGQRWGEASYYFSNYVNIWGWASWRRVWNSYDPTLQKYTAEAVLQLFTQLYGDQFLVQDWVTNFEKLKAGEIDTWDHQFNFLSFFEHALCITPNINLISNIGFGEQATHTLNVHNPHAGLAVDELWYIKHPAYMVPQPAADLHFLAKEHHLEERWRIYNKRKNRFRRWLKGIK